MSDVEVKEAPKAVYDKLDSFRERMAAKDDNETSDEPQATAEAPIPVAKYNVVFSFVCSSEQCKGGHVGITDPGLVVMGLRGAGVQIECPRCGVTTRCVPERLITTAGELPLQNREQRRRASKLVTL